MTKSITYFASTKVDKRKNNLKDFLNAIIDPEEQPVFVSNEASVYDITLEGESEILDKIRNKYKISITPEGLSQPLWKLIDYLYAE